MNRDHAGAPGEPGVGVGSGRGAALVPGRDEPRTVLDQRVRDVEVAAADHAEDVIGSQPDKGRPDDVSDGAHRDRAARKRAVSRRTRAVPHRSTRASTRTGLPEPPVIGRGGAITTAPVAGRVSRLRN